MIFISMSCKCVSVFFLKCSISDYNHLLKRVRQVRIKSTKPVKKNENNRCIGTWDELIYEA